MPTPCNGVRTPAVDTARVRPTADEVARRALELYERRGSIDGWDLDDWFDGQGEPVQDRAPKSRGAGRM